MNNSGTKTGRFQTKIPNVSDTPKSEVLQYNLCWHCGNKLRPKKGGGYIFLIVLKYDLPRVIHKACDKWV